MRALPRIFFALIAALTLAACATPASDPTSDGPAMPEAEGSTQYPYTWNTWFGEQTLQERPERVAVVSSPSLDMLQAVEVTPVYALDEASNWAEFSPWRDTEWYAGIEVVDSYDGDAQYNFEQILQSEPDVIVALHQQWVSEEDMERLSEIAPVIEFEGDEGAQIDWRVGQRLIGEALDLASVADEAIAEADSAAAKIVEENPQFAGKTLSFSADYGPEYGVVYLSPAGSATEEVFGELGFEPGPNAADFVADESVSEERIAAIDADVVIMYYFELQERENREASELFQQIPAVADGRYVGIDATQPNVGMANMTMRFGMSSLSYPWILDQIANTWLADFDLS